MPPSLEDNPSLSRVIRDWWKEGRARAGFWRTLKVFVSEMVYFLRDSTPARKRQRYGDIDFDWEHRVDTTSATVGFRARLLGTFHSLYQATEPGAFRDMMEALPIDFRQFTFVDLGSGKGRTLLMASDYPFARILGAELFPQLHRVAEKNIRDYRSDSQKCFSIGSVIANAKDFVFPIEPLVVYLFNPFAETVLERVIANLEKSIHEHPRPVYLVYHNPLLEAVVAKCRVLNKLGHYHQYVVYGSTLGDNQ